MSHNLNVSNGRVNAAYAIDKNGLPWHHLGQMINHAMTKEDAQREANLNWKVSKQPLWAKNPHYNSITDTPKGFQAPAYAIVRDDINNDNCIIGVVGDQYKPIQNTYMFDFVDTLLESTNGAHYESAGSLGKGEKVWCLARVPSHDFSLGNDKHQTYLLFANSHDGSMSGIIKLTTVRVVCQNTLSIALSKDAFSSLYKIRHSKNAEVKMEEIKDLWTGVDQDVKTLKDKFKVLINKRITGEAFRNVMDKLFGDDWEDSKRKQNTALRIAEIFDNNDSNAFPEQKGTAYNLLNAVTNYIDHEKTVRITETSGYNNSNQVRADAAFMGTGDTLKKKALEVIYDSVDNLESVTSNVNYSPKNDSMSKILSSMSF